MSNGLLIARCVLLLTLSACSEELQVHYPTYADAVKDDAFERGWLPRYLPVSAKDISEAHDLDSNAQRLRFRVPIADARELSRGMLPAALSDLRSPQYAVRLPALSGPWPAEMERTPVLNSRDSTELGLFVVPDHAEVSRCLAVEWKTGTVYAWTCKVPAR